MKLGILLLAAACGGSQQPPRPMNTEPAAEPTQHDRSLPPEVQALLDRWELCWHFAGEEPYDATRQKEIADAEAKYCPGNEDERARLKSKYRDRADVQTALKRLDEMQ